VGLLRQARLQVSTGHDIFYCDYEPAINFMIKKIKKNFHHMIMQKIGVNSPKRKRKSANQMKCTNSSLQKHRKRHIIIPSMIKVHEDWDVTPYRLVNGYRRCGRVRCLQFLVSLFLGCYNLKMKVRCTSELWVAVHQSTQRIISEDLNLH
jgi:hypothetical protein